MQARTATGVECVKYDFIFLIVRMASFQPENVKEIMPRLRQFALAKAR
jgi:hypothetical protein